MDLRAICFDVRDRSQSNMTEPEQPDVRTGRASSGGRDFWNFGSGGGKEGEERNLETLEREEMRGGEGERERENL